MCIRDSITSDPALEESLRTLYGHVATIDLWVGALAEDHLDGAAVGELLAVSMYDQFERLAEGDRFFFLYDQELSELEIEEIMNTTLADVILRNTELTSIQGNVFYAEPRVIPEPTAPLFLMLSATAGLFRRRRCH